MNMSDTIELDRESDPQAVRGYAFYDWAKSAFETSVTNSNPTFLVRFTIFGS